MRKVVTCLILSVILLCGLGILILTSAASPRGASIWTSQLGFFGIGIIGAAVLYKFDYHWYKKKYVIIPMFVAMLILLMMVWVPGIGRFMKGSYRWLVVAGVSFQPSELAKLVTVIVTSVWVVRLGPSINKFWKGAVLACLAPAAFVLPVLAQPDFGCALVLLVLGGSILLVGRVPLPYLIALAVAACIGVAVLVVNNENRMERIRAHLDGSSATSEKAHQPRQARLAFKAGGLWGVGLGQSMQKHQYLPEAHTDYIFAIVGEELGLPATLGMVVLFAVILACGITISLNAPDRLGRYLALGATLLLVFQGAFNMAVVSGLFPPKGLALPFISSGGSSILTDFLALGLLLNVGYHILHADGHIHTQYIKNVVRKA